MKKALHKVSACPSIQIYSDMSLKITDLLDTLRWGRIITLDNLYRTKLLKIITDRLRAMIYWINKKMLMKW